MVGCGKFEEMDLCGIGELAEEIGVEIVLIKFVLTVVEWGEAGERMVG